MGKTHDALLPMRVAPVQAGHVSEAASPPWSELTQMVRFTANVQVCRLEKRWTARHQTLSDACVETGRVDNLCIRGDAYIDLWCRVCF